MNALLKATAMTLGAGCVLLLAGGFPLAGAPGVYGCGLMLLLGWVVALLCLWGAWRLSAGARVRLICGLVSVFLACAGVVAVWDFGRAVVEFSGEGMGSVSAVALWFGRLGLVSYALVGLMFAGIFGFFAVRLMHRRLWLVALHLCVPLLLLGAHIDYVAESVDTLRIPVGGAAVQAPHGGFSISIPDFEVSRYEDAAKYTLLRHEGGAWRPIAMVDRQGDELVVGGERYAISELHRAPDSEQRFLLLPGAPPRLLLEGLAPVQEYRARCRLTINGAQGQTTREELLRVNDPISCEGRLIYLMNYIPATTSGSSTLVEVQVRRAPGRLPALLGMVGIILCTAGWAFSNQEKKTA